MIYFLGKEKAEQRFKQWSQSAAQHAAASVSAMQLCRAILMQSRANLRRTWSLLKTAKMWLNPQWAKWYQWAPLPSLGPLKIITTCPSCCWANFSCLMPFFNRTASALIPEILLSLLEITGFRLLQWSRASAFLQDAQRDEAQDITQTLASPRQPGWDLGRISSGKEADKTSPNHRQEGKAKSCQLHKQSLPSPATLVPDKVLCQWAFFHSKIFHRMIIFE